ncbi:MOS1T transposase, partial [Pseudoatta argentina]
MRSRDDDFRAFAVERSEHRPSIAQEWPPMLSRCKTLISRNAGEYFCTFAVTRLRRERAHYVSRNDPCGQAQQVAGRRHLAQVNVPDGDRFLTGINTSGMDFLPLFARAFFRWDFVGQYYFDRDATRARARARVCVSRRHEARLLANFIRQNKCNSVENRGVSPAMHPHRPQNQISMPLYAQRHDKVILLHDNARPHVAKPVKTYLETLKWEVLPHPPYSPDIAPSNFHLFRSMAHGLADRLKNGSILG